MTTNEEIIKTCENCKYEFEDMEGVHCRHCIHNAEEHFEPKEIDGFSDHLLNMGFTKGYAKAIDEFAERLQTRIKTEIDDCADELEWIDEIAEQMKAGGIDE